MSKRGRKPGHKASGFAPLPDGYLSCAQCDYVWRQQSDEPPQRCPNPTCRSYRWQSEASAPPFQLVDVLSGLSTTAIRALATAATSSAEYGAARRDYEDAERKRLDIVSDQAARRYYDHLVSEDRRIQEEETQRARWNGLHKVEDNSNQDGQESGDCDGDLVDSGEQLSGYPAAQLPSQYPEPEPEPEPECAATTGHTTPEPLKSPTNTWQSMET